MSSMFDVLVAYVPTPHAGYLKFFRAYARSILYVLGKDFIRQFPSLVRHLPGAEPEEVQAMVRALGIFPDVRILTPESLETIRPLRIVMPDEDVSHALAEKHLADASVTFDGSWRLRWDWGSVQKSRRPEGERVITSDELHRSLAHRALKLADRSPDWWRQVGALLVRDGEVLLAAFNRHVPSEQSAYCYGDPRSQFEAGRSIEVSDAMHAEMGLAAEALQRGICTEGCDVFVSTFPCPPCAYPWAHSGIKRLFYIDGYSLVSAAETLDAKDVEIVRVDIG